MLWLPPRQCVSPHQSDCCDPCCLRPSPEGSATGARHFEATSAFTSVTARRLAPHPYDGFVDGLPKFGFPSPGHPSYGASDLCPGGFHSPLNTPAFRDLSATPKDRFPGHTGGASHPSRRRRRRARRPERLTAVYSRKRAKAAPKTACEVTT